MAIWLRDKNSKITEEPSASFLATKFEMKIQILIFRHFDEYFVLLQTLLNVFDIVNVKQLEFCLLTAEHQT